MHKLDRTSVAPPECLDAYDYQTQRWGALGADCKRQLRAALVLMQGIPGVTTPDANEYGLRCAYCEGSIHHAGHIEHFRRKNREHHPELTFAWGNLFLACGANAHCGHYKDRKGAADYDPDHLIKPDEQRPSDFLHFHSTGEVWGRTGLSEVDAHKAAETIRVFGLNEGALPGARAKALSVYKKRVLPDLDEVAAWSIAERQDYLAQEIQATRWDPYATTIQHFLQNSA